MPSNFLSSSKIIPFNFLELFRTAINDRCRVVTTNGCFDILHVGHVTYLQKAKTFGDVLILGVDSDSLVKALKGESRPINNQDHRAYLLSSLSCVDFVTVFPTSSSDFISKVRPDVYVKGGDYDDSSLNPKDLDVLSGINCVRKFVPFEINISTSKIIKQCN